MAKQAVQACKQSDDKDLLGARVQEDKTEHAETTPSVLIAQTIHTLEHTITLCIRAVKKGRGMWQWACISTFIAKKWPESLNFRGLPKTGPLGPGTRPDTHAQQEYRGCGRVEHGQQPACVHTHASASAVSNVTNACFTSIKINHLCPRNNQPSTTPLPRNTGSCDAPHFITPHIKSPALPGIAQRNHDYCHWYVLCPHSLLNS